MGINVITIIFKCLAHTSPSPPLLPGPHNTNTFIALDSCSGYAVAMACAHERPTKTDTVDEDVVSPANSVN